MSSRNRPLQLLWCVILTMLVVSTACDRGESGMAEASPTESTESGLTVDETPESPGEASYGQYCRSCHGPYGVPTRAGERIGAATLSGEHIAGLGADGIRDAIVTGRVNMRPFTNFSDQELGDLVDFVLALADRAP